MRSHKMMARPQRLHPSAWPIPRLAITKRQIERHATPLPSDFVTPSRPNPYVDYSRSLTSEGGVLIVYKDIDRSLLRLVWRFFVWLAFTIPVAAFICRQATPQTEIVLMPCFVAYAILLWLLVFRPLEVLRSVEIRPDCMIVNGTDVFWQEYMECGWPNFREGAKKSRTLSGIYGTRFVDFLAIAKFDDCDRAQEVFASHLQDAMRQLWVRRS